MAHRDLSLYVLFFGVGQLGSNVHAEHCTLLSILFSFRYHDLRDGAHSRIRKAFTEPSFGKER